MPVIVIYEMGRPPRQVSFDKEAITIGRAVDSDIQLGDTAVSRLHALIRQAGHKVWQVKAAGRGSRVSVSGKEIHHPTQLREGTEIQIGPVLLVFSLRQDALSFYQGTEVGRRNLPAGLQGAMPAGPLAVVREEGPADAPTHFMDAKALQQHHELLRAAQKAWVQNVSPGPDGKIRTIHLDVNQPCLIGKGKKVDLQLKGLTLGFKPTVVCWAGQHYTVTHLLWYPRMLVNGRVCRTSELSDGDLIQVGQSSFRFRTG